MGTDSRVKDTCCGVNECVITIGRVMVTGCVGKERLKTGGRVVKAGGVEKEGARSLCRVEITGCVATKDSKTDGRVASARGEGEECIIALRGIAAGIASVRRRDNCLRCWKKRKAGHRDEKY